MRKLITGVDAVGRSSVVEVTGVDPADVGGGHGVNVARVFATDVSPPPARGPATGMAVEVALPPGVVRWMVVEHPPHQVHDGPTTSTKMHHSDALDLVFVYEGSGELELRDGLHAVSAGDCIVMPGVDHAMRPGPDGCRLVVFSIGTPPPAP